MDDPRITNPGSVYGLGQEEGFYGIWDLRAGGEPVARFPKDDAGWVQAWDRFQELEGEFGAPPWRQARPGWVLLHVLIGIAMGIGAIFLLGIVVAVTGRQTTGATDSAETALGVTAFAAWMATLTGWLLFVYLRRPLRLRLAWLLSLIGAGVIAMIAVGVSVLPRA